MTWDIARGIITGILVLWGWWAHRQLGKSLDREMAAYKRISALQEELTSSQEILQLVLDDRAALQDRVLSQDAQLRVMRIRSFTGGKWSQN
jgi:hypothetical protein